jgi:hypothetical protein
MDAAQELEISRGLRAAMYRGDGDAIVSLLTEGPCDTALQLAGEAVLVAVTCQAAGATGLGAGYAAALRQRGWSGDNELAEDLEARLGTGPAPLRRGLPVDLEMLTEVLEGDPRRGDGLLDLETGQVWPAELLGDDLGLDEEIPDAPDRDADGDRWLDVECRGSRDGYRDMQKFLTTVPGPELAERLRIATDGPGAFRRFRRVLEDWPAEEAAWRVFDEDRRRGRARAWLAETGYIPSRGASPARGQ